MSSDVVDHSGLSRRHFLQAAGAAAAVVPNGVPAQPAMRDALPLGAPSAAKTTTERVVRLRVNGADRELTIEPRVTLLDALREVLALTGTKKGCDRGQCGACTVLVDGRATKACTMLAVQADGAAVVTIEGLAKNGELHPIQRAFAKEHGLQCGFCTPGLMITAVDFLERNASPSDAEIRHAIEGNLCRCTGYHNIVNAIRSASVEMRQGAAGAPSTKVAAEVKP
jgi:aerobic-type carbon monoxide dehydrogenase small subunit (CoxS/CutS family)